MIGHPTGSGARGSESVQKTQLRSPQRAYVLAVHRPFREPSERGSRDSNESGHGRPANKARDNPYGDGCGLTKTGFVKRVLSRGY